ncbi:MAG: hypothetical protein ACRDQ7_16265 [Haloechinothrix sp.]
MVLSQPPAGGAPIGQILIALAIFFGIFIPLALFVIRERAGKRTLLGRLADWAANLTGLPRWAAVPMALAFLSGMSALIGVYWDVPTHMELGRDEGPLDNPSHYPIYFGLIGIFATGVISAALAKGRLPVRTFRIGPNWHAPMGSIFMMVTGFVGLSGFPLDDLWHRLFGQDVTEWGPTHVLMIGGGICVVLGLMLLLAESRQAGATGTFVRWLSPVLAGAWMMGASAFLMEFDLGVPQFPMLSQVVLVGLISGWTLVYARMQFGPGATAVVLVVFFLARAIFVPLPLLTDLHASPFLPYIAEAVVVEVVALAMSHRKRGYRFAIIAGVGIGTIGMPAEWAFSQWLMPYPWPAALLPLFIAFGTGAGVAGALIGAWQHHRVEDIAARRPADRALVGKPAQRFRSRHALGLAGALGVTALMAAIVVPQDPDGLSANISLTETAEGLPISHPKGGEPRWVDATVTLDPADAAEGAIWFSALSWQGGDFFQAPLERVRDGVYQTTQPMPVYGEWKTGIRLHTAPSDMALLPVYAPEDTAANAPLIEAVSGDREFGSEITFLQRERKEDTPAVLWFIAYIIVGAIFAGAWSIFAWCYVAAAGGQPHRRIGVQAGTAKHAGKRH